MVHNRCVSNNPALSTLPIVLLNFDRSQSTNMNPFQRSERRHGEGSRVSARRGFSIFGTDNNRVAGSHSKPCHRSKAITEI